MIAFLNLYLLNFSLYHIKFMVVILPTVVRLVITNTDILVAESEGSTTVGVLKMGRNERPVTVEFSTQDGTATGIPHVR